MTKDEVINNFTYHSPSEKTVKEMQWLRRDGRQLALLMTATVPDGREKDIALQKLEEAIMWANAGLARNQEATPRYVGPFPPAPDFPGKQPTQPE